MLERYQADPQYRIAALRGLVQAGIRDAIEKRDAFTAYSLADDLVMNKNATFDDRLLRLTLLRETKDSFRDSYLTQLENESQKSYASLNAMVKWIVAHQAAAQCSPWLEALPTRLLKKPPLAKSTVEAFLQEEKWEKAVEITLGEDWEDLDWMRLAYLSIAQAGSGRATLSETTWRKSVDSAQDDLGSLTTLLDLATKQNWPDQRVDLLWKLSEISSEPEPILTTLLAEHLQHRDTARAYRACSRLIETHSATLQNQWARLSLLQGENTEKALAFVRTQHLENPDALDARLVLAMGYLRERRFAEAYFLLRQLPADQLQEPRAATYFGIASAWLGMIDAGRYLIWASRPICFPRKRPWCDKRAGRSNKTG